MLKYTVMKDHEIVPGITATPRIDAATHIPFVDTEHFEREGFSGDIFVSKEAKMGFTALQVNVHGAHPLKEILRGNTRSYFVADGEGTFVLNGESRAVSRGDLIVIPAGSQYEYQGEMTLFEFNVSPGNSFQDRKIEPPKDHPERNPADHHSAKLEREKLAHAIAELLKRGYTLTNSDIKAIMPHYGYSERSPASSIIGSPNFIKIVDANGAKLSSRIYKNHEIYLDGNIPQSETDLADTIAKIEESTRSRKRA
jgi:mannose-6-phosphate isomerase-like protein (cupin superfamily)